MGGEFGAAAAGGAPAHLGGLVVFTDRAAGVFGARVAGCGVGGAVDAVAVCVGLKLKAVDITGFVSEAPLAFGAAAFGALFVDVGSVAGGLAFIAHADAVGDTLDVVAHAATVARLGEAGAVDPGGAPADGVRVKDDVAGVAIIVFFAGGLVFGAVLKAESEVSLVDKNACVGVLALDGAAVAGLTGSHQGRVHRSLGGAARGDRFAVFGFDVVLAGEGAADVLGAVPENAVKVGVAGEEAVAVSAVFSAVLAVAG